MKIKVIKTEIDDILIFEPEKFIDKRGCLIESFNQEFYSKYLPEINFVQENESLSSYGVLRGLHFQLPPFEQAKLVRVVKGEVQDIAVDIRPESKTYKKYISIILNDSNKRQLYIPRGFAHAFLVLSKEAIVSYKMDNYFNLESSSGIKFDDLNLNINWKLNFEDIILSDKDKSLPYLINSQ